MSKLAERNGYDCCLICSDVSQVCRYAKTYQIAHFMCSLLYTNYTPIKTLKCMCVCGFEVKSICAQCPPKTIYQNVN